MDRRLLTLDEPMISLVAEDSGEVPRVNGDFEPVAEVDPNASAERDEDHGIDICEATTAVADFGDAGDQDLEPLLRATIRRALAEHRPNSSLFRAPGVMRKLGWHVEALFSCRYYEDIAFERTHRFQVEEAFLLRADSLVLVGYASKDSARQTAPWRAETSVGEITGQLRDLAGDPPPVLRLSAERKALMCVGSQVLLVTVTRGTANEMHLADLEFVLRRIENRFRDRLAAELGDVRDELRPFLEDCLLIQAPVG